MKSKFTFKHEGEHYDGNKYSVEVTTEGIILSDVIAAFEDFLKGCGFSLSGKYLDLTSEEDFSTKESSDE